MKVIVAMSGASGAIIGIRLLEVLGKNAVLIASKNAKDIIEYETAYSYGDLSDIPSMIYDNDNLSAEIASGTSKFDAMVIAPCSTSTLSKIACGIGDNLITRVASVALKERRKLIVVPRETPLSPVVLKRMYELSLMGAVIMPPVPAFYLRPESVDDIVNYLVGKIMDHLGLEHSLYEPYTE